MILRLLEKFQGENFGDTRLRVVWGPVLPEDRTRLVADEQTLIQTGIHSRRRAMDELGVKDPEIEFRKWLEERETILRMNKDLNARTTRNSGRERADDSQVEGV